MATTLKLSGLGAAAVAITLVLASRGFAQEHPVFDNEGTQKGHGYFTKLAGERIDTLTGNLRLSFTDLELPGNAGLDLRIERSFNSKGRMWRFGLGGLPMTILNAEAQPAGWQGLSFLPVIVLSDGGKHASVRLNQADGNVLVTADFWRYSRITHEVQMPNGWIAEFDQLDARDANPTTNPAGRNIRYLTAVSDPFGNRITLSYLIRDDAYVVEAIRQYLGEGQTRTVTFEYEDSALHPLTFMRYGGRTWTYEYLHEGQPRAQLSRAIPPVGAAWQFAYSGGDLASFTTPQGGTIGYTYDWRSFGYRERLRPSDEIVQRTTVSRVVTSRTMSDGGTAIGGWSYDYSEVTEADKKTVVTGPVSVETTHYREGSLPGEGWSVDWRTIADRQGNVLQREDLTYELVPYNNWSLPPNGHVPVTKQRIVTWPLTNPGSGGQANRSWTTTYSYNPGDFDLAWQVVESGDFTRTTTRTFKRNIAGYRKPVVESQTIEEGGRTSTATFGHNSVTGFVTSESHDGITLSFEPDAFGNTASEKDALHPEATTTTYTWGTPKDSTSAAGTSIGRSINEDGTVATETRRGQTTHFQYDALSRLTKTIPPAGNEITSNFDSPTAITVTTGTSFIRTGLDGFARPVGTVDSMGVKTSTGYDAEGRTTFASLPYTGPVVGDTLQHDALGRLRQRTHSDGHTFKTDYEAGGGGYDTRITDENGHVSIQRWAAAGDPAHARQTGLADADGKEWHYSYHVTGVLSSVVSPPTPGHAETDVAPRTWMYNANNQLQSETHPESGTTTYSEYDTVGNLKVKTDQAGTTFQYDYDADNRPKKGSAQEFVQPPAN